MMKHDLRTKTCKSYFDDHHDVVLDPNLYNTGVIIACISCRISILFSMLSALGMIID